MNRVMNERIGTKGAFGKQSYRQGSLYGQGAERDYLVEFFRRLVAFLTSAETRTVCTAVGILGVVLLTVGIAGGVEHGVLSINCLLPLAGLWGLGAFLLHRLRK